MFDGHPGWAVLFGWLFTVLIITTPIGRYILNRLPQIITLRPSSQAVRAKIDEYGNTVVETVDIPQRPFIWRAVYFLMVGWWFSALWLVLAWVISVVSYDHIYSDPTRMATGLLYVQ